MWRSQMLGTDCELLGSTSWRKRSSWRWWGWSWSLAGRPGRPLTASRSQTPRMRCRVVQAPVEPNSGVGHILEVKKKLVKRGKVKKASAMLCYYENIPMNYSPVLRIKTAYEQAKKTYSGPHSRRKGKMYLDKKNYFKIWSKFHPLPPWTLGTGWRACSTSSRLFRTAGSSGRESGWAGRCPRRPGRRLQERRRQLELRQPVENI